MTRNLISLCLSVFKLPYTKPEILNAKPEVIFPNLCNCLCHQFWKRNKAMICWSNTVPDSIFYILICKVTKSDVLFFITKSVLKHVPLISLTLSTTQSLNWMVSLWKFIPSDAITLVQEKSKILCRLLILLYIWTQNKVLLFKHKVKMFTLEPCIILIKTQTHAFEPLLSSTFILSNIKWNLNIEISVNSSLLCSIANINKHTAG